MKAIISTDGEKVSAHFGRCPNFTLVEIQDEKIVHKKMIPNPGHHPGFLPNYFHDMGIEYIIAGGMGRKAAQLFDQYNITPIVGITGGIDSIIEQLIKGTLKSQASLCQPGGGKGYGIKKTELK